ncbi:MAG: hypothetical protein R3348_02315 [Xanthomonadales bacterium]|nr:hypothetical protein [Xanthomonadales bacterium]
MSFFDELKRRNVFRVGVAYAVASWVLLQVADLVLEAIEAPSWVIKALILVVVLGFIAAIVIAWAYELTPEGIKREAEVDRSQSITPETGRKLDRIIIAFLAIAVIVLLYRQSTFDAVKTEPGVPQAPSTAQPDSRPEASSGPIIETPEKSVAVLPFANMSDDPGNEFFADGISEEILNALARVRELKVAGRTSAFAFKDRNEDLREIGQALGVSHILEGSVRKAGNRVRVTAQLIQASDGFHLWSDTYDRELTDIFAIQDDIANAILEAMRTELLDGGVIASDEVSPEAYEKYLLARQRAYSRDPVSLAMAVSLLEEATTMEPEFAEAWAQRGILTLLLADDSYGEIPHAEAQRLGRAHLDRALELDPNSAEALAGMGLWHNNEPGGSEKYEKAVDYLEKALAINPSMIDASNWLQLAYSNLGREKDSIRLLEEMFRRDPFYKPAAGNLIWSYSSIGRYEMARAVLERIRPYIQDEEFINRFEGNILLAEMRFGEAHPLIVNAYEKEPANPVIHISLLLALQGLGLDEQVVALQSNVPFFKLTSLIRLGRTEEAGQLAPQLSAQLGSPQPMIEYYHSTRQPERLVDYIDSRWPDLSNLRPLLTGAGGFGDPSMIQVAYAYKVTGNEHKSDKALAMARAEHDRQIEDGFDTAYFHVTESSYWAVAGDHERSLESFEKAVERNFNAPVSVLSTLPEVDPYLQDERFRELMILAHQRFNDQRVLAGFEPIPLEW